MIVPNPTLKLVLLVCLFCLFFFHCVKRHVPSCLFLVDKLVTSLRGFLEIEIEQDAENGSLKGNGVRLFTVHLGTYV